MALMELNGERDGVIIALAYATAHNFTGAQIYRRAVCYLHEDALGPLRRAVALAAPLGLKLKILDAFRPAEAQWVLWNHTPDPEYIADPRRGSVHSMGVAVDLTLVDGTSGAELDMGTPFDDLRPVAWHGALDIAADVQRNRHLLLGLMSAAGFDFYDREWWHYQLFSPRARYPLLSDSVLPVRLMTD
jgi:D-alanyl-D-alanine dipeptidase